VFGCFKKDVINQPKANFSKGDHQKKDLVVTAINRDNTEITVNGKLVSGLDDFGCLWNTCNAWDSVFTGNDRTMDQHAAAAFDDRCGQWRQKGHVWLDGIADQHLSCFKIG
jgi:hypothetical protein